ncbi:hypothetical protein [Aquimarina sediminis]|uniref:hypothetical protein n=1 Tax=Aquimarina sediminis TaxID=2070536 RepID=UPI000CA067CC|nr:hypothetical protein [Aquimarina sediminis]
MKTEYITLKEASLNNNCPECYSTDGMILSFKQQRLSSKLLVKTKSNIIECINCSKCENQIFPGQWTTDIERVYNYHKKTIPHKSGSLHFTGLFYFLVFLFLIIASGVYLYLVKPELIGL